jgi:hypothetical protein
MGKIVVISFFIVVFITIAYNLWIMYTLGDLTGVYKYKKSPDGIVIYVQYKADNNTLKFRKATVKDIEILTKTNYLKRE